MAEHGSTTSLDVRTELIVDYPSTIWNQNLISGTLMYLYDNEEIDGITFKDNGRYREYSMIPPIIECTKKELREVFKNHKGKFQTVSWIAKDGIMRTYSLKASERVINDNGYYDVVTSTGQFKQLDPRTMIKISANKKTYVKKGYSIKR